MSATARGPLPTRGSIPPGEPRADYGTPGTPEHFVRTMEDALAALSESARQMPDAGTWEAARHAASDATLGHDSGSNRAALGVLARRVLDTYHPDAPAPGAPGDAPRSDA